MKIGVAIPVLAVVCLTAAHSENVHRPAAKPPASKPEIRIERQQQKQLAKKDANPGSAENLEKLLKLSPDQRNKALASLPPARRAQIEKRLDDYLKMPEVERARALDRLRRMQTLPPQRQQQVRASLTKLQTLPVNRRNVVQKQLNQMRVLSDADRSAVMNSEEFRSKFTPAEQQIVADICLVTPKN